MKKMPYYCTIFLFCIGLVSGLVTAETPVFSSDNSSSSDMEFFESAELMKYPGFYISLNMSNMRIDNPEMPNSQGYEIIERSYSDLPLGPVLLKQRCFGGSLSDIANSIIQTNDGGYLLGGASYSTDGDLTSNKGRSDYWLIKLNPSFILEWQKSFGGSSEDFIQSVIQTFDGGYLVSGTTWSDDGDVTNSHGSSDIWLVKVDSSGVIEWQRCFGGHSSDYGHSVIQIDDGGYLVAGYTNSNDGDVSGNHGQSDYWIIKVSGSGILEWQRCYGGSDNDLAYTIIQDPDGGYLISGITFSSDGDVSENHGSGDYWLVKIDSSGTIIWEKTFGGSMTDWGYSVLSTTDGGYLLGGITTSLDGQVSGNHGSTDLWMVKITSTGIIEWQKCLGGTQYEQYGSAIETRDGGLLVIGYTSSNDGDVIGNHGGRDIWVVKLGADGSLSWQKCLGGSYDDYGTSLLQAADSRYLVAGYVRSNDGDVSGNHGNSDVWLASVSALHQVNATSDRWTIVYPNGNRSYIEGTDADYLTQAKPGAVLEDIKVNGTSQGPVSNWTFPAIMTNHTISGSGSPIPGQLHVHFTYAPTSDAHPLPVQFFDLSVGSPTSWFWQFGDGGTSTEKDPVYQYKYPGTYTVSLRAYNEVTGGYSVCNNCITVQ